MNESKQIELIYENCEVLDIPIEYVSAIHLGHISKDYYKDQFNGEIISYDADVVYIEIKDVHKLVDKVYKSEKHIFDTFHQSSYQHVFDLLVNRQDITRITVNGIDYAVPYDDKDDDNEEFDPAPVNYKQKTTYNVDSDCVAIEFCDGNDNVNDTHEIEDDPNDNSKA